ncbi:hypothetical protein ACQF36_39955 [Streptomyces sp. Marseille-Q5077]|uniref:hypothetical protein n=1 Tax=Streptomyces sp. Marseille-Q5077 TaxID=3418995 RepID=UPI003CFC019C
MSLHKALDTMKCPTREGLRDAVRNLEDIKVDMLLPGVTLSTGPDDAVPLETMQLMRFKGERRQLFGEPVDTRKEFGSPENRAGGGGPSRCPTPEDRPRPCAVHAPRAGSVRLCFL